MHWRGVNCKDSVRKFITTRTMLNYSQQTSYMEHHYPVFLSSQLQTPALLATILSIKMNSRSSSELHRAKKKKKNAVLIVFQYCPQEITLKTPFKSLMLHVTWIPNMFVPESETMTPLFQSTAWNFLMPPSIWHSINYSHKHSIFIWPKQNFNSLKFLHILIFDEFSSNHGIIMDISVCEDSLSSMILGLHALKKNFAV